MRACYPEVSRDSTASESPDGLAHRPTAARPAGPPVTKHGQASRTQVRTRGAVRTSLFRVSSPMPGYAVTTPWGKPGPWMAGYHTGEDYSTRGAVGIPVLATRG